MSVAGRARLKDRGLSRAQLGYILVTPALVVVFGIVIYPIMKTLWFSLHTMRLNMPFLGQPFIGVKNYTEVFVDLRFWNSMWNTAHFTTLSVLGALILGMAAALVMNKGFVGRGIVRATMLIPWAMPVVITAQMWKFMYNDLYGVVNDILVRFGILGEYINFLGAPDIAMNAVIVAEVWRSTPFVALILLAGLQIIPKELYEAARVDGATVIQQFRHVTLPLLKSSMLVALLFRSLDAFKNFDLLFALTEGGPGNSTENLSLYTYREFFGFLDFGYGSALAVVMVLVCSIIAFFYVKVLGLKIVERGERS